MLALIVVIALFALVLGFITSKWFFLLLLVALALYLLNGRA